MKARAVLVCAGLALAGCGSLSAPDRAPPQAAARICPAFRAWSEADLKALAQALAPIPEDSVIMRMALDWRRYYGDAKACAGPR
jgi:hypothetical protein